MASKSYDRYWVVFGLAAQPALDSARQQLLSLGMDVDPVTSVVSDDEKGLGFTVKSRSSNKQLFVDLWLLNGVDRGFGVDAAGVAKVSVSLSILDQDGEVRLSRQPYNRSPNAGVSGSLELLERINGHFDSGSIAAMVGGVAVSVFKDPRIAMERADPTDGIEAGVSVFSPGF